MSFQSSVLPHPRYNPTVLTVRYALALMLGLVVTVLLVLRVVLVLRGRSGWVVGR